MTLHTFDKRLLEFMYQLTLHQKLMTHKEMSQVITIQGEKVSERTIKRWLKWLKTHHYFTYYPHVIPERIGLVKCVVLITGLKDCKVLDIIPYKTYSMLGTELNTFERIFTTHYNVPQNYLQDFESFWRKAQRHGLVDNYKILKLQCSNALYAPVHQLVNGDGRIDLSKSMSTPLGLENLNHEMLDTDIHSEIKKNPFLIPFLIEYYKANTSSRKVWCSMKQKLAERIWDYIKDVKIKNKKSNGKGVHFAHRTLEYLHKNFNLFFRQIRVAYGPLYRDCNVSFCAVLNLKDKSDTEDLLKEMIKHSLFMTYNRPVNGKRLFLEVVTNTVGLNEIIGILSNWQSIKINEIVLFNYARSSEYWEDKTSGWLKQHYHELFDPKTVSWRYDSEKYLQELQQLSTDS